MTLPDILSFAQSEEELEQFFISLSDEADLLIEMLEDKIASGFKIKD